MKRLFVLALIALLLGPAIVYLIEYDSGYLLVSYGRWTLETSVWVAFALACCAFVVLSFVAWFVLRLLKQSRAFGDWFSNRGSRRIQLQTTRGMIAYSEGNWLKARRVLTRSAPNSDTPLINYLFAARASHELGDEAETKSLLAQAEKSTAGAGIAVELTQAEMQFQSGHLEECLATLSRLKGQAAKHPYVLRLLRDTYIGLNDWAGLTELLPALSKAKIADSSELGELELRAAREQLLAAAQVDDGLERLQKLWQAQSKVATKDSQLVAVYCRALIAKGEHTQAEKLLRTQLGRDWQSELVDLYGQVEGSDAGKQLLHAENWLKERNSDARLMLCLGRLSLRNQLWGKAREYFESSLKLEQDVEACAELARLLAALGEHEKSNDFFQRGLLLSAHDLPALPLPH